MRDKTIKLSRSRKISTNRVRSREDAIRMRYELLPLNLPEFCDGCGKKFTLDHAMNCKFGGVVHRRHDALKYELMNIAAMATRESAVGAEPLINPGSLTALRSNSDSNNDTVSSKDRGDIIVWSLWGNQHDGIIDVRLTNTDAPGYGDRNPKKVLQSAAKSKKAKYLDACFQQWCSFTPFVVSIDGMLEKEAKSPAKNTINDASREVAKVLFSCGRYSTFENWYCYCLRNQPMPSIALYRLPLHEQTNWLELGWWKWY